MPFFVSLQEASPEIPRILEKGEHGGQELCHRHFHKHEGGDNCQPSQSPTSAAQLGPSPRCCFLSPAQLRVLPFLSARLTLPQLGDNSRGSNVVTLHEALLAAQPGPQ